MIDNREQSRFEREENGARVVALIAVTGTF